MAAFRISRAARTDIKQILAVSLERWGEEDADRYRALLTAALRAIRADPAGPMTRDRSRLLAGVRSFHIRHARTTRAVRDPVHVIYFQVARATLEIVRVLHERVDPGLHLEPAARNRGR